MEYYIGHVDNEMKIASCILTVKLFLWWMNWSYKDQEYPVISLLNQLWTISIFPDSNARTFIHHLFSLVFSFSLVSFSSNSNFILWLYCTLCLKIHLCMINTGKIKPIQAIPRFYRLIWLNLFGCVDRYFLDNDLVLVTHSSCVQCDNSSICIS